MSIWKQGPLGTWIQDHVNAAEHAFRHPLVEGVIAEYLDNLSRNFGVPEGDALVRYGLKKCMSYMAQVARAEALNIDPDLLRADADAITERQRILIEEAERAGVPVIVVTNRDCGDEHRPATPHDSHERYLRARIVGAENEREAQGWHGQLLAHRQGKAEAGRRPVTSRDCGDEHAPGKGEG